MSKHFNSGKLAAPPRKVLSPAALGGFMLPTMSQTATSSATDLKTFAGVLAAVDLDDAASWIERKPPARETNPRWFNEAHDDDVATISYEQALRNHSHFPANPAPLDDNFADSFATADDQPAGSSHSAFQMLETPSLKLETRRTASVTLRLSKDESVQVRARAAEAGLTVSAYFRSCAFEVEQLRTQVKQLLAEMRTQKPVMSSQPSASHETPHRSSWWAALICWFSPTRNARH